jgi:hypothetical protein
MKTPSPNTNLSAFVAYPSNPPEIASGIRASIEKSRLRKPSLRLKSWEANDIPGRCLVDPILSQIESTSFLVADITRLNFNVVYEIGYAIGVKKRAILVLNSAVTSDERLTREVGIFDTLGYTTYSPAHELCDCLCTVNDLTPLPYEATAINRKAPVYVVAPREKTEAEIHLFSRLKKQARLFYRSFDPEEHGRLSVRDAIESVAASHGVVLPLLSSNRVGEKAHNLRCAFVAGLSHGMGKVTLLLQAGDEPTPLDLRDYVRSFTTVDSINPFIAEFAPQITERLQQEDSVVGMQRHGALDDLFVGASAAENEFTELGAYYLQTDEYHRVLRGEIRIVAGRKGSGKTALFFQVRNKVRADARNLVLDLNPEGFQLRKLKTVLLRCLEEGTREHTMTAFWEYLLLLEISQKFLEKVGRKRIFNQELEAITEKLQRSYVSGIPGQEGDFAERMLRLTDAIEDRSRPYLAAAQSENSQFLDRDAITGILYAHDIRALREDLAQALGHMHQLWILFDNIDKGWRAHGIDEHDLLSLRCLIEAMEKLQRFLRQHQVTAHGVVFIRNDVFELLLDSMPDRGKVARIALDWTDPELLREVLRRRFVSNLPDKTTAFESIWGRIARTHLASGEDTSEYLIARCLMRPRGLIELFSHCKSHAVNLGHPRIESDDFLQGESAYSTDLINHIDLEIQDVFPDAKDILYGFIEAQSILTRSQVVERVKEACVIELTYEHVIELLMWYGVLGVVRSNGEFCYIYNVNYEMKKLKALAAAKKPEDSLFCVNPAFWHGLDIVETKSPVL